MPIAENFEFVNRTEELEVLRNRVFPHVPKGTFTFLRSPSGFGKSRLTDRLMDETKADGSTCVVIDPAIRSKSRSERIYAWFFVQRAAEPGARRAVPGRREFRTFADFLRRRRWRKIDWKQVVYENSKGATSLRGLTKTGIELAENLLKIGRYSPNSLLQEDSRFASEVAQEYVGALANYRPTLLVIRECQNIDPESLRFLLSLGETATCCSLIFEYTNRDYTFSAEHEKIIFETVSGKDSLVVFDLLKLDLKEFRYLLRKYAPLDKRVEATVELHWDGNLRIIRELKYRIMVGDRRTPSKSLDLRATIQKNISDLSTQRRLILAVVAVHIEAIDRATLIGTLRRIDPSISPMTITSDLAGLETDEEYIRVLGNSIREMDPKIRTSS
jgi:hypothetical protein